MGFIKIYSNEEWDQLQRNKQQISKEVRPIEPDFSPIRFTKSNLIKHDVIHNCYAPPNHTSCSSLLNNISVSSSLSNNLSGYDSSEEGEYYNDDYDDETRGASNIRLETPPRTRLNNKLEQQNEYLKYIHNNIHNSNKPSSIRDVDDMDRNRILQQFDILQQKMKIKEEQQKSQEREEAKLLAQLVNNKQRLLDRFKLFGVREKKRIEGDGNCQFSAVSDQLFDTTKYHLDIRQHVAHWLNNNPDYEIENGTFLRDFLETDCYGTWSEYCQTMAQEGTWGDHMTLVAISELFKCTIVILSSVELDGKSTDPITVITPRRSDSQKVILLSHLHENHYGSLTQEGLVV